MREREHLTDAEVERLIEAARDNRHGYRDALMILMAYRHGLRAAEVTDLKWEQVDFDRGELHVNRLKGGTESTHPLDRSGIAGTAQAAGATARRRDASSLCPSAGRRCRRKASTAWSSAPGAAADLGIKVHAHMLRQLCGFKLANDGIDTRSLQAYLGHSNIQNTTRYTALASGRFKNFWRD